MRLKISLLLPAALGLLALPGLPAQENVALGRLATQSSQLGTFGPELGVDGNLGNFTHTQASADLPGPAWWEVDIEETVEIGVIVLWNRTSCCGSRLRDIVVQIFDADGVTVAFETTDPDNPVPDDLLNPENDLGVFPDGPTNLVVNVAELTGAAVEGRYVRVLRLPDEDLSGTGGQGNTDEGTVLSLGEVEVFSGVPECPADGDTHCEGITADGPLEGDIVGLWTVNATATDESGDPIIYNFTATHEGGTTLSDTVVDFGSTTFDLQLPGSWTITVTVDDIAFCDDEAADATCEVVIDVEGLPAFTDANGLILTKAFLVLGPFSHPFGCGGPPEDLLGNHIANARIECEYPEEGDAIDYDVNAAVTTAYLGPEIDGIPTWRAFDDGTTENGDQDLTLDIGQMDDVVSWLVTYVEYLEDEPVEIEICLGSDDGGQLWLDGQLLVNDPTCRVVSDCDVRVPVTVEPGVHRLAAAAWNRGGGWGLRLSLQEPAGPILDDEILFPEWVFHGRERPAGLVPPECAPPVTIDVCDLVEEDGSVELAWSNPPDAANPIAITVNGDIVAELPSDATSTTIDAGALPAVDPILICVDNGAPVPACCSVSNNIATGKFAEQSSTNGVYAAALGVDGDLGNFTHTLAGNSGLGPAIWEVDLGEVVAIEKVVLHNRDSCCGSRLRDIILSVHDWSFHEDLPLIDPTIGEITDVQFPLWEDALFESDILNEENELGAFPLGPDSIEVDLEGTEGRFVRVTRIPDRDLSGTGGQGNNDEADVLSLGEVQVFPSRGPVVCPEEGDADYADTECSGVTVSGPAGNVPGTYTATASATDATNDTISYTFTADDGAGGVIRVGPRRGDNTADFDLTPGTWAISVAVDDSLRCDDVSPNATCSTQVTVISVGGATFVRGDADASGAVNITDAIFLLGYLFQGTEAPPCMDAADVDGLGDNAPNITDAIFLLGWLFQGSAFPPSPTPLQGGATSASYEGAESCGADPEGEADGMGCVSFPPCEG
jgi:hypothetical protein